MSGVMLAAADWQVIWLSLKVSGVAVLVTLPVAFVLAWALARAHKLRVFPYRG